MASAHCNAKSFRSDLRYSADMRRYSSESFGICVGASTQATYHLILLYLSCISSSQSTNFSPSISAPVSLTRLNIIIQAGAATIKVTSSYRNHNGSSKRHAVRLGHGRWYGSISWSGELNFFTRIRCPISNKFRTHLLSITQRLFISHHLPS